MGDIGTSTVLFTLPVLAVFAGVAIVRLVRFFLKRFEDRNVEVATTERERAYREPVIITREEEVRPAKTSLLALFALIPLGAATIALGVLTYQPNTRSDRLIPTGITFTMMGFILVGKRLYATWRARRNARLEIEWEKWLDSADSCEVGPRKWTK